MNKRSPNFAYETSAQTSDAPLPTAEYYWRTAEEIRRFAERTTLPDVRRELFELAELFERMARRAERRENGLSRD
jgi:hypothetical protein